MVNKLEQIKRMIILCIIHLFNLLPIKNNKIFLFSYYGAQYGDNPKYISEYIKENDHQGTYDIVWAFTDLELKQHLTDIRKVKVMTLQYFYELCTSKDYHYEFQNNRLLCEKKKSILYSNLAQFIKT